MKCLLSPRPKNAAATRQAMLVAARTRFLQESYENVGLREIAADVGVDVALVSRYFGSKEELFKEVLRGDGKGKVPLDTDRADLAQQLTCLVMQQDDDGNRENVERLLIILRSASSPKAAEIVRDAVRDDVLAPIVAMLDGPHGPTRASLALAVLMGATVLRTVMAVQPLCDCDSDNIGGRLKQLFETALSD